MTNGWVTIEDGEEAIIYNLKGESRTVTGPRRLFLWREKVQKLRYHSANQTQYLRVVHRNGSLEHKQGPIGIFENPLIYTSVRVHDSIPLDANEVLVVYLQGEDKIERRLVYGPQQFFLAANEWIHNFSWHGTDPANKTRKIPNALCFSKLRVIPDQFYYNVDEVRTNDDAVIKVKLMIFFELRDVELMLAQTADPIGDFINALCADVVAFSSQLSYEEFLEQTSGLNDMDSYPVLMERSKRMGYAVTKVIFRGYHASDQLQGMHDRAVSRRTQLQLQMESEEQKQSLTDLQMQRELERAETEQKLALDKKMHEQKLKIEKTGHEVKIEKLQTEEKIRQFRAEKDAQTESSRQTNAQILSHLGGLQESGVDITEYMLSRLPKPDKTIRVVTAGPGTPNVHVHPS
ncbi:uncharacterized protein LOC135823141 [Sycon ciliatum]|uniref:uncharacterized protein LOC135823141 n=1 Tax=Sycon ciliatum TaxID=27933 RepID=UPI0020AC7830|eukprot:scpid65566/ scgid33273/ 